VIRALFYEPIFNILIVLYRFFGNNLGWAIVVLAILTRLLTFPITKMQIKSAQKGKEFQKKHKELKKKYGKNKKKLNEELAKLQSQYLPGQLAGCLPFIILIIFLIQVRNVIRALVAGPGSFNEVAYSFIPKFAEDATINLHFFGMDLSKVAADFSWSDSVIIPYVILALLVGISQLFSTRIMTGIRTISNTEDKDKRKKSASAKATARKKKGTKKEDEMPDMGEMMTMMNKQMMFFFPVITIITSLGYWGGAHIFPSGISVFWTVQSLFVIMQQLSMNRKKVFLWFKTKFGS
jgi:YidC/Oxa1 family membrane protein insertase